MLFEGAKLLGQTERSIPLATSAGTGIPNLVELEPDAQALRVAALFVQRHGREWKERKAAAGRYNCAGHVWASRRTAILDPAWMERILQEDGYRLLPQGELPLPDDLVLYRDCLPNGRTELLHVGRVFSVDRDGGGAGVFPVIWVISKWNSTSGEWMHRAFDVPYGQMGFTLQIDFVTDRPHAGARA